VCCQVLYDLGVVSTKEPFGRLVSQGMILGEVEYTTAADEQGRQVDEDAPGAVVTRVSHSRVTGAIADSYAVAVPCSSSSSSSLFC
jgi:leucyl-tRNA synthetase